MKVIEVLNLNKELLTKVRRAGIRLDNVQYVELYKQYRALVSSGNKVSYTVARLAEEYAISERKVYDLIKRFDKDCNLLAV